MTPEERLWSKVTNSGALDCWEWVAYRNPAGYGQVYWDGKPTLAHRVIYELMVANIPDGLTLDHLCRNRACVNPWHLEPVPRRVNTARGVAAHLKRTATTCKRDHEFTPENTIINQRGKVAFRQCRQCTRERQMRWYLGRKVGAT